VPDMVLSEYSQRMTDRPKAFGICGVCSNLIGVLGLTMLF